MNKTMKISKISLLMLLMTGNAWAAKSAKDIMVQNEENRRVNDFQARSKLETGPINTGSASAKVKEFTLWRKVQTDGIHNSTLTRFHVPAEVRNEGILIIENPTGKNDVLLYLPNFKKIRRVETQQQSGSFMGSTFSYSDIATPHVEDYSYRELRTETCPTAEAKGILCHVIECTPASEIVKERTGYSKSILWVRDDNSMGVQGEYYNLEGALFKQFSSSKILMVDTKNKKWLAHEVTMKHLKNKEYTRLEFSSVKVNQGIADSIFTQQNLQKVK
jgi:outer membrane lipoprotein-sorting protein